jgi:hypothetical protein
MEDKLQEETPHKEETMEERLQEETVATHPEILHKEETTE